MRLAILGVLGLFAILQSVDVGSAAPIAGTAIVATQVLLLWRVRTLEKESGYQRRLSHWRNDAIQAIALKLSINLLPRPERS